MSSVGSGRAGVEDLRLLYVVPYLNDPAVRRRLRMLRIGGVRTVLPVGFRRTPEPIEEIDGEPVIDLGRTEDGRFAHRAFAIAAAARRVGQWGPRVGDVQVIMARSLEAVLLARAFRRRFAPSAPLVYESLDIHRFLLGPGVLQTGLRRLEARSMADCALLVTSSPGFVREYFTRYHEDLPPVALLENKLLATELTVDLTGRGDAPATRPAGPPWRIGWFGLLRCERSLHMLADLCRRFPDLVRVELRGRAAITLGDQMTAVARATPGMTYHGPYDRTDLLDIYSQVHFCWTPDFSESGANSDWLLPNRLYEAGPAGCVPIAVASVESGRWLATRGIGVLLEEPMPEALAEWVPSITTDSYAVARDAVLRVPLSDFVDDREQARAFVEHLADLRSG
jgi:succinoglycan biosynthesis protein ExoL